MLLSFLIALSFISVNAQRYAANLDMTVIKNYKKIEKSYEIYSLKKGSTYHVDSIYQITTHKSPPITPNTAPEAPPETA